MLADIQTHQAHRQADPMLYHVLVRSLQGAALIAALVVAGVPVPAVADSGDISVLDDSADTTVEVEDDMPLSPGDETVDAHARPAATDPANGTAPAGQKPYAGSRGAQTGPASPLLDERGPDYYDRRAAEILKQDNADPRYEPHPLMSAFPDQEIIVCTAGCRDGSSAMIVSMKPKPVPVNNATDGQDTPGLISCVGGCPENRSGTLIAMPAPVAGGSRMAATVGEWMTTVAKVPANEAAPAPRASAGAGSGAWMNTINSDRAPVEAATVAPAKVEAKVEAPAKPETKAVAALETPKAVAAPAVQTKTEVKVAKPVEAKAEPSHFDRSAKVAATPPPAEEELARKPVKQTVVSVLSEDKEMNAAIKKARTSLDVFWKSYETPGPGEADFALKVAISGNGSTEHFWLTRIQRDGEQLSGLISNQPQSVKTVKMGQRFSFTTDMISDWTFKRNSKLVGNETMRVLLPRMPEEQAAVYRQMYETP
jgi:uncharacterized protein YegJ (DUF2314 family)